MLEFEKLLWNEIKNVPTKQRSADDLPGDCKPS